MTQLPSVSVRLQNLAALVLLVLCFLAPLSARGQSCPSDAYFEVGPRLASVDSQRRALLNALLGDYLDTSLSLTVADWESLATADVSVFDFLDALKTRVGVSSVGGALTANASLFDVFSALADVSLADGETVAATVLNQLATTLNGLTGTIQLGDLLDIASPNETLSNIRLDLLQVVQATIELFNYENVVSTPNGVTVSGSALGLEALLNEVQIFAQVIEPPAILFGPVGTDAHVAAVRIKLDMDLVDVTGNTTVGVSTLNVTVGDVSLYFEMSRADAVTTLIDWITPEVKVTATPAVADVYIGRFVDGGGAPDDGVFFNRNTPSTSLPASLEHGVIGDVKLGLTSVDLLARALVQDTGAEGVAVTFDFVDLPPTTQTVGVGSAFIFGLVDGLFTNLDVELSGTLIPGADAAVALAVKEQIDLLVKPGLKTILTGMVDDALDMIGAQLGEVDVTMLGGRAGCL